MSYILELAFWSDALPYYIETCPSLDTFNEVFNPVFATTFKTKKDALKWAQTNTDLLDYITVVNAATAITQYNEWSNKGTIRCQVNKINRTYSRPYNLDLVVDRITHKTKNGFLLFPIFDHYLSEGGNSVVLAYNPKTGKATIQYSYNKDKHQWEMLEDAFEYLKHDRWYE